LYLSDTGGDKIFVVRDDRAEVYLEGIKTPNGLVYADGVLFATLWTPRELVVINAEKKVYRFATGIPESDGLEILPNGDFLVASWGGGLYHVARPRLWRGLGTRPGAVTELLNLRAAGVWIPDVCYLLGTSDLLVPTFNDHRVRRYGMTLRENATDPYLLPAGPLAGEGLRRVTNSADPERELYQRLLFRGEEISVYVVASETKTATYPAYPIDEFIHVLDGRARLRPAEGEDRYYRAGRHFLVPAGYRGDWETQGGDGLYYELSVVGNGEGDWPVAEVLPKTIDPLLLVGNPPTGVSRADTLLGTKLRVHLTADTTAGGPVLQEREQFLHVRSGTLRLRNAAGREWTFRRGDFFVLPTGFRGRWNKVGTRPLRCLRVERRRE
ncbi:MAG: cupin domain-containing protein, partial [Bacteroidota bacterium]